MREYFLYNLFLLTMDGTEQMQEWRDAAHDGRVREISDCHTKTVLQNLASRGGPQDIQNALDSGIPLDGVRTALISRLAGISPNDLNEELRTALENLRAGAEATIRGVLIPAL